MPSVSETDDDEWLVVSTAKEESGPSRLRVLTWNIWFEPLEVVARMNGIANIIQTEAPDILALQEVTAELEGILLGTPALTAYHKVPAPSSSKRYYTLLLAHEKLQWSSGLRELFPSSKHGRDRLMGTLQWCGIPLRVTNVHLESPDPQTYGPDDLGSTERRLQLAKVLEDLCHDDDAIVLGDFNHIPKDGEFPTLPPGASDVWETVNPHQQGLTYNGTVNGCVRSKHSGRPDRVLLGARLLSPCAARLVGTQTLPLARQSSGRPVMPSDHFGVLVDFSIASSPEPLNGWTTTVERPVVAAAVETSAGEFTEAWVCDNCGFSNRARNDVCGGHGNLGCKQPKKGAQTLVHEGGDSGVQANLGVDGGIWTCACGFKNRSANKICGGTGTIGCKAAKPHSFQEGYRNGPSQLPFAPKEAGSPSHQSSLSWTCSCGFRNRGENRVCGGVNGKLGCKGPKPGSTYQ